MNSDERQILSSLFERTRAASANPRDAEAEAFIAQNVQAQPHAPYVLAQAVLVQEQALQAAAAKIEELEAKNHELEDRLKAGASSFLGGVASPFAANGTRASVPPVPAPAANTGSAWGRTSVPSVPQAMTPAPMQSAAPAQAANSGGFLKGALSTAAGVAGGVLLANSISSLFSGHNNSSAFGSGFGGPAITNHDSPFDHKPDPQLTPASYTEPQVDSDSYGNGWSSDDDMTEA
jgi:hypothetical protein